MILALDTSNDQASLALADQDSIRAEWSWIGRGNHSQLIDRVLPEFMSTAGTSFPDITGIVVAKGPGSFSGVRVAVSRAKGLAMALQVPLVGISTLDVIGFQASACGPDVWAIMSAGRGQFYGSHYTGQGETWRRSGEYLVMSGDELEALVSSAATIVGDGPALIAYQPNSKLHPDMGSPARSLRRAGFLAELGRRYLDAGGHDQLNDLEPLYLRPSAAEEKRAASRQE